LERMLPELEDLENRELFTREEIKEIVRKRRDFEYLLKRHSTLKVDYLRYVEYETQLEEFRRSRKEVSTPPHGKRTTPCHLSKLDFMSNCK
jgi:U3 small nucleolar RNA-associated protein 6